MTDTIGSATAGEQNVREEVLDILASAMSEHLGLDIDVRTLAGEASLPSLSFDGHTMDSLDLLVLVIAAEEHFDCDIEDAAIRTNFTWGGLVDVITSRVHATRSGAPRG